MKWWALAKQFPKYALVAGIIVGSTALFAFWWLFLRSHPKSPAEVRDDAAAREVIAKNAEKAEARIDYLFLADDDLYDAETGECLFKNWLRGDHPVKLFYDQQHKRLFGQYDQGFVSYAFDGTRIATMTLPQSPPALVPGSKKIVFARGKDIWTADIDWEVFKFINERRVTTMGVFYEQHFADNVQLLTEKTLVVRNLNDLLRIDLETGNVKPGRLPLNNVIRHRSPDSKWLAGAQNGEFFCYDVDGNTAQTIPVGRNGISEIQWLGNDRCLGLVDGKTVVAYDRPNHALSEMCPLPFPCFKMGEPSPDGRFIFCAGGMNAQNGVLVDLDKNTAAPVKGGAGVSWVSNDTFAYSRDVPDSDLRGVWLQTLMKSELRVLHEPYLVRNTGPELVSLSTTGLIVMVTKTGLTKLRLDGKAQINFANPRQPSNQIQVIQQLR